MYTHPHPSVPPVPTTGSQNLTLPPPHHRRSPPPAAPSPTITTTTPDIGTIAPPLATANQASSRLDTHNIPPQFLSGGGGDGRSSSTRSPYGVLASNYSLKSELENIRLEDHCFVRPTASTALEPDEYPDPENINLSSLMSRMRQIRSSGQIQYRIPKKRRREDEPKARAEGELVEGEEEEDLETVTIQRQKRVRKSPRGPRSEKKTKGREMGRDSRDRERERRERAREWREREREGLLRPACHPPMVLETILECHPPMALDDSQFIAMETEAESEMKLVVE